MIRSSGFDFRIDIAPSWKRMLSPFALLNRSAVALRCFGAKDEEHNEAVVIRCILNS
jgi:hypothetical protein